MVCSLGRYLHCPLNHNLPQLCHLCVLGSVLSLTLPILYYIKWKQKKDDILYHCTVKTWGRFPLGANHYKPNSKVCNLEVITTRESTRELIRNWTDRQIIPCQPIRNQQHVIQITNYNVYLRGISKVIEGTQTNCVSSSLVVTEIYWAHARKKRQVKRNVYLWCNNGQWFRKHQIGSPSCLRCLCLGDSGLIENIQYILQHVI